MLFLKTFCSLSLKLLSLYTLLIACFSLCKRKKQKTHAPKHSFSVVIAARNEAAVIGQLIDSLKAQDYPASLFQIYVVPNNCTDETAAVALAHGAEILCPSRPVRNKGEALQDAFGLLLNLPAKADAYAVFDADNIVHPAFLREMNHALCNGALVAKGRNMVKNPYDTWVSGCYSLYFSTCDRFYNHPRVYLNLSAKLNGTGFVVQRTLLEEMGGWPATGIAEDAEFASHCAAHGTQVAWVPAAISYDEAPLRFKETLTQRMRWVSGIMQVATSRVPVLLKNVFRKKSFLQWDMILFLLNGFVQIFSTLWSAFNFLLNPIPAQLFTSLLSTGFVSYLGLLGFSFFTTYLEKIYDRRLLKSIFLYPLFTISWLPLQVYSLFQKTTVWKPMVHQKAYSLQQIQLSSKSNE